jgi:excinuclease ABC subunit A
MAKRRPAPAIRLKGVRHNNLKNFDLDLPVGKLIVVTGLSGSGKSSLAFDTLFAEGQRRYIETFSPYARQFFDRMDKPQVDRIEGIPPAIAIEQRNTVKSTRSTVGTMTEICDHMKLMWPHLAKLHCRQCAELVRKDTPQIICEEVAELSKKYGSDILITFQVPLTEKLSLEESLALIAKQGYQRVLFEKAILRLDEILTRFKGQQLASLTIIQDRLKVGDLTRPRLAEACEHAYHYGKCRLQVYWIDPSTGGVGHCEKFSSEYHCARCDIEYREPISALFSFNHPVGACPKCRGFGRVITIDYNRALPDRSKTLARGAVKPWQTGQGAECQRDLMRMCKHYGIPTDVPFQELSPKWQEWVVDGDPEYGKDDEHEWPRAWYGIKGYFRWLESKAYKMHVRVLLSRYRAYSTCPDCNGKRFQPESLLFKVDGLTLADFYLMSIEDALAFINAVTDGLHVQKRQRTAALQDASREPPGFGVRQSSAALVSNDPIALVLNEVRARLLYLVEVGLGYLTLDRPTRSLSGGETERVNLTTCLGSRLVNTLYVLDEPSVGLHSRDTERLVRVLHGLRDLGNTVVVVEHEASVIRAADRIVDLGPGHGESGGQLVFQGTFEELKRCRESLTGQYLAGSRRIEMPKWRPIKSSTPRLILSGASRHNLKNLTVEIPLNRFVCLTGVSGSGKTTLAREVLLPALQIPASDLDDEDQALPNGDVSLQGAEQVGQIVLVDQAPLGRTPRSNPAVYTGAFDDIRELFGQMDVARQRGLNASAFSFNSGQGQCERCRGAGFEKIEMQFLSDVFIRCPDCNGRRYRSHILEVKLQDWSIADMLDASVDDAIQKLLPFIHQAAGRRALQALTLLQETGLGYLRLGQPINTLSGGEAQRLKLASHLAEFARQEARPTLFVFDEPTTGLHFEDIRILLKVFQRLVDAGHSLLVIEHNLDVIKSADWVIDLGPEAGDRGGHIVAQGTPAQIAACAESYTGRALSDLKLDELRHTGNVLVAASG